MTTDKRSEGHSDEDSDVPPPSERHSSQSVPSTATTRGCPGRTSTTRSVRRRRSEPAELSSRVVLASERYITQRAVAFVSPSSYCRRRSRLSAFDQESHAGPVYKRPSPSYAGAFRSPTT